MDYFKDKVTVITGAGSGMGRELARQLAAAGCHLALSDINMTGLQETVSLLENPGSLNITSHRLDVSDREAVADYVGQVMESHKNVDVLINNAGIAGRSVEASEYDYSDYQRILDVNLWGVIHCSHEFLPHLLANPGSHLVNISSIFGLVAPPKSASYVTSKFAVRGYTEALRTELEARDVHVSCVHPGVIATNIAAAADAPADVVKKFADKGMPADKAASVILKGIARKKARIRVAAHTYLIDWIQRLLPASYRKVVNSLIGLEEKSDMS